MNKRQRKKAHKKFLIGKDPNRTYVTLVNSHFNRDPNLLNGLEVGKVYPVANRVLLNGISVVHASTSKDLDFLWVAKESDEREREMARALIPDSVVMYGYPKFMGDLRILHVGKDLMNTVWLLKHVDKENLV